MSGPRHTRLRFISAGSADELTEFVSGLEYRIQIYSMSWNGEAWFLWYMPPDDLEEAMPNVRLEDL